MSSESDYFVAEGITTGYGPIEIIHDVSFTIDEGEIVAIVGPNGAGKTTLINVLGSDKPDEGTIHYKNEDITSLSTHERVARGISLVPERRNLFRKMTVRENLILGAYRNRDADRDALLGEVYDLFPRLQERSSQRAGTLSGGESQMLTIGRALMTSPDLLLLDEPTIGLAPKLVPDLFDAIRDINDRGVSIVLVEQRVKQSFEVSDYGYLLENGEMIREGPSEELVENEQIIKEYLGES